MVQQGVTSDGLATLTSGSLDPWNLDRGVLRVVPKINKKFDIDAPIFQFFFYLVLLEPTFATALANSWRLVAVNHTTELFGQ